MGERKRKREKESGRKRVREREQEKESKGETLSLSLFSLSRAVALAHFLSLSPKILHFLRSGIAGSRNFCYPVHHHPFSFVTTHFDPSPSLPLHHRHHSSIYIHFHPFTSIFKHIHPSPPSIIYYHTYYGWLPFPWILNILCPVLFFGIVNVIAL